MAKTKYDMTLTDEQREFLNKVVAEGKESDRTILRAKILLLSDLSKNPKMSVPKVAELVGTSHTTVQTTRFEFGNYGLETALYRKERRRTKRSDDIVEKVVALSKQKPPHGKERWTIDLLLEECINQGIAPEISRTTIFNIMHDNKQE